MKQLCFCVFLMAGIFVMPLPAEAVYSWHEYNAVSSIADVNEILKSGISVNEKDKSGATPLHFASKKEVVEYLLAKGADINAKGPYGETPLIHYLSNLAGDQNATLTKLKDGRRPRDPKLFADVRSGKYNDIPLLLIAKGADVKAKSNGGATALHYAAVLGNAELIKTLLAKGADVNASAEKATWRGGVGGTPLLWAGSQELAIQVVRTNYRMPKGVSKPEGLADIGLLLISNGADVKAKNEGESSPLLFWASSNNPEVARQLIAKGAEVKAVNIDGTTPLHNVQRLEVAELLIAGGADVNARDKVNGGTPLYYVNSKEIVELLIAKGADIHARDNGGSTPLHLHVSNAEIVSLLMQHGADVNAKDESKRTPLHNAALWSMDKAVIRMLVEHGANINDQDKFKSMPIHQAVTRQASVEDASITELLIELGADVNARDNSGRTPLELKIAFMGMGDKKSTRHFIEQAKVLLKHGADPDLCRDKDQVNSVLVKFPELRTLLAASMKKMGKKATTEKELALLNEVYVVSFWNDLSDNKDDPKPLILALKAAKNAGLTPDLNKINDSGETALVSAARAGLPKRAKILIENGADIELGRPLSTAFFNNHDDIAKLLILKGAKVGQQKPNEWAPIFNVRSKEMAELLIAKGAKADVKADAQLLGVGRVSNYTPLHNAGSREVAEVLIAHGADVNAKDSRGYTPLHEAKNVELATFLIEKGAKVDAGLSDNIYSPLAYRMVAEPNPDLALLFMKKGADLELEFADGSTLLHFVKTKAQAEMLLAAGRKVNAKDGEGKTPLHRVLENGWPSGLPELVAYLVAQGADVDAKDKLDRTPLFYAVQKCFVKELEPVCSALIDKGASVKERDVYGYTPLFYAKDRVAVDLLLARGADIAAKGKDGRTALHSAVWLKNDGAALALVEHGTDMTLKDNEGKTFFDLMPLNWNKSAFLRRAPAKK